MLGLSRLARLGLIATGVIILGSLYLLYPHHDVAQSPGDFVDHYEAGGIDSPHWNKPITPEFDEEPRWTPAEAEVEAEEEQWSRGSQSKEDVLVVEDSHDKGLGVSDGVLGGGVIMPKLVNETAKAELGRAAWKVLHLMTLRYPETPSDDDREALRSYFHLFSRLYPCGECAAEFQALLKEYPPQTSSRKSASMWLCHVHNLVNERLGKPEFDCLTLNETYDCGCGPEGEEAAAEGKAVKTSDSEIRLENDERAEVSSPSIAGKGEPSLDQRRTQESA